MTEITTDLRSQSFIDDKYGTIEALRSQSWYARLPDGVVFFNQEDAVHVMRCEDFRFAFFRIDEEKSPYLANAIKHELLNMHGEQHARLKQLVMAALRDRIVAELRERITTIANELVDAMPDKGTIDFTKAFADPYPSRVLGPMYDIPYGDIEGLDDWIRIGGRKVDALQSGDNIGDVEDANRKLHDYLRSLLRGRRDNPGDDIFSELMAAEIDGDRLSEDELVYLASELAAAGVDTTRNQLPLILHELLVHPDQMQKLRDNPRLALRTVDEGMRFAPLPWAIPHQATHQCTYKGIDFAPGDLAMVLIPGANRDPEAIANPNVFDIERDRARNFSFGSGMHMCPGAQLARMEMSIALETLVARLKSIRLVEPPVRDKIEKGEAPLQMMIEIEKA